MGEENAVLIAPELGPDKAILPIALECVTAGKKLAETLGGTTLALIMGSGVGQAAREMARFGLDRVYLVDHPALEVYQPELFLSAFRQVTERVKPKAILFGDTLISLDLAPRIAFSLKTGLLTDCVGFEVDQGTVLFRKPVYSSNIMAAYTFATEPYIVTLRSRVAAAQDRKEGAGAEVIPLEVELDLTALKTEVIRRVTEEDEGPKLTESDIIISGGRGIGGPEGFELLSALAKELNAAVGASRPPIDLGWAPPKTQVGQTGEKVAPSVYIAIGISGATQHIAGMQGSKKIVAINKDPKANIFRIADYGIVGDYMEVVPALIEAISETRN